MTLRYFKKVSEYINSIDISRRSYVLSNPHISIYYNNITDQYKDLGYFYKDSVTFTTRDIQVDSENFIFTLMNYKKVIIHRRNIKSVRISYFNN